jgi:hypothetical protein
MEKLILSLIAMTILLSCDRYVNEPLEYPLTKKVDVVDNYFGTLFLIRTDGLRMTCLKKLLPG